ncbi:MAG: hypothetical protein Q9190_003796 [Brigantiaea leucoxantha]
MPQVPENEAADLALFRRWADEQNIRTSGVRISSFPGSGIGVAAERTIEVAFDEHRKDEYKPWMNLWPSPEVFQETMPFGWLRNQPDVASPIGCGLLPPSIGGSWAHPNISEFQILEGHGLLQKQMRRLKQDWIIVSSAIAEISFDRYVYYWLIVNTRSLYFEMPNTKVHPPREDRMVLCPFIDFFNHDDHGCHVTFGMDGYKVVSDRRYKPNEEMFVSYGNHSNDFLLVEYGFILDRNKWDHLPIDDLVLAAISDKSKERLENAGYMNRYELAEGGVCFRTQVALRTETLSPRDWYRFLNGLDPDDASDEAKAKAFVELHIAQPFLAEVQYAIAKIERDKEALADAFRQTLLKRWAQIEALLLSTLHSMVDKR